MSAIESGAPLKRSSKRESTTALWAFITLKKASGAWLSATSGSDTQGHASCTTLTWMLGIQERTNSLCLDPGLEHIMLAGRASLDEIHNPILLDAIIHSGCFDDPES